MIDEYSGSLTGEPIMLHETRIVSKMILEGLTKKEIKNKILENNCFGYKTKKSIPKRLAAIFRRLKRLDDELLKIIVDDLSGDGKILVVYAIALEDKLFNELISEFVSKKLIICDFEFSKKEILRFIEDKARYSDKIASFKDCTKYKLSLVMFNILKNADIIVIDNKKFLLKPVVISYLLKKLLNKQKNISVFKNLGVMVDEY